MEVLQTLEEVGVLPAVVASLDKNLKYFFISAIKKQNFFLKSFKIIKS
jgi:hypothetical protein